MQSQTTHERREGEREREMKVFVVSLSMWWLIGCATYSGWEPTVDPRNSNSETLARDLGECQQLAKDASGDAGKKAGIGALVGGVVGAASGAVIGAAAGNVGKGAGYRHGGRRSWGRGSTGVERG